MSQIMQRNFAPRLTKPRVLTGLAAAMLLAGCASATDARTETADSPIERIQYEFQGKIVSGNTQNDCLDRTPYDTITDDHEGIFSESQVEPAIVGFDEDEDGNVIAVITPDRTKYPDNPPLRLTGFEDVTDTLKGADEASQGILTIYGCPARD